MGNGGLGIGDWELGIGNATKRVRMRRMRRVEENEETTAETQGLRKITAR